MCLLLQSLHQNIGVGSSAQQEIMWENRTCHGFASVGISNPPSWTVSLPSEPSQILQLQEPPQVFEGLPLPDTIEVIIPFISDNVQEIARR